MYVAAGFADWDVPTIADDVRVMVIDVNDETYSVASDTRTGWLFHSVVGDDGYVYFSPPARQGALHRIQPEAPEPTILRIRVGESGFDPDSATTMSSKVGDQPAGTLTRGPNGAFWIRALDASAYSITPETDADALSGAAAWRWFEFDPASPDAAQPVVGAGLGLAAGSPMTFLVDGRWYSNESLADYSQTTLIRTDGDTPTRTLQFPGWANAVVCVR